LDLLLLITDSTVADSTQTALKKFARADFLIFQNKIPAALAAYQAILKEHKTDEIIPVTLLRVGKIYEKWAIIQQHLQITNGYLKNSKKVFM